MSFMGYMVGRCMKTFSSVNPEKCDDPVKVLRRLEMLKSKKTSRGYEIFREKTEEGTLFERANKIGAEKNGRVVLFFHGGAYFAKLTSMYRKLAKDLCEAAGGAELYLLDYKCAPEYRYPTQLNEAFDLWRELTEKRGYSPKNIVIGGDSAGGNLTLAFMLKLRDEGKEMPRAAFCISPWGDLTGSGKSYFYNYPNDVLFGKKNGVMTEELREKLLQSNIYLYALDTDRTNPYVSPTLGDYHGFPPMYFTVGGHELLLDDTLTIVEKLKKEGISVGLDIGEKMFHIYTLLYSVIPEAKVSFNKIKQFITSVYAE